jgi:hypothetical protein
MKRFWGYSVILAGILAFPLRSRSESKSYQVRGSNVVLQLVRTELFVEPKDDEKIDESIHETIQNQKQVSTISPSRFSDLLTRTNTILKRAEGIIAPRLPGVSNYGLDRVRRSSPSISAIREVFQYNGIRVIPLNTFALRLADTNLSILSKIEQELNVKLLTNSGNGIYTFVLNRTEQDVFALCKQAARLSSVVWSEPDLAIEGYCGPLKPRDPFFTKQWTLHGPEGIDIEKAWSIYTNAPGSEIVVAVLDNGVDTEHPDLKSNLLPESIDIVDNHPTASPDVLDVHGTACAGVIGGVLNNVGIAGAAPQVKILAIRTFRGDLWLNANAAKGIAVARLRKANIISCSWGGPPSERILEEIDLAAKDGCLIVASAGNDPGPVLSPADQLNVLPVGASNPKNTRWSYSAYGLGLLRGVVAPSGDKDWRGDVWTTDVHGFAGRNHGGEGVYPSDVTGDYISDFGGTSAASALVAGVAAMVWSACPNLSAAEIRSCITETAEKVDLIRGGWKGGKSEFYGAGKIDPFAALTRAYELNSRRRTQNVQPSFEEKALAASPPEFVPVTNLVAVSTPPNVSAELKNLILTAVATHSATELTRQSPSQPDVFMIDTDSTTQSAELLRKLTSFGATTNPVYTSRGRLVVPTGTFTAKILPGKKASEIVQQLGDKNVVLVNSEDETATYQLLRTTKFPTVFEAVRATRDSQLTKWAEADLLVQALQR